MTNKTGDVVLRHKLPDRIFHWFMAVSILVLMGSAFFPMVGVRFSWLIWHWPAGIALTLSVIFHLWRVISVHRAADMLITTADIKEVLPPIGQGPESKFNLAQKSYHLGVATMVLVLCITGILMLAKIDTFLWGRNPSILSDANWGIVYVLHGLSSLVILFLTIVHIYFGLVPHHREYLTSIILGNGPKFARKHKT